MPFLDTLQLPNPVNSTLPDGRYVITGTDKMGKPLTRVFVGDIHHPTIYVGLGLLLYALETLEILDKVPGGPTLADCLPPPDGTLPDDQGRPGPLWLQSKADEFIDHIQSLPPIPKKASA